MYESNYIQQWGDILFQVGKFGSTYENYFRNSVHQQTKQVTSYINWCIKSIWQNTTPIHDKIRGKLFNLIKNMCIKPTAISKCMMGSWISSWGQEEGKARAYHHPSLTRQDKSQPVLYRMKIK